MSSAADGSFSSKLLEYTNDRLERLAEQTRIAIASGEVEAVHALRVASRRLNEPLLVMRPWLRDRDVRNARRLLRRTRAAFRRVRDLDVLQMSLAKPLDLDAGTLAQLEGLLTKQRERALARAVRRVERLSVANCVRAVRRLLRDYCDAFDDDQDALVDGLAARFNRLASGLLAHDPRSPQSGDLHDARIRVKRCRYTLELGHRIEATDDAGLIQQLTDAQDMLGQWNDHLVAAKWISRIATRRTVLTRETTWGRSLLEYAARRVEAAERQRLAVLERWPLLESALRTCAWFGTSSNESTSTDTSIEASA